MFTAIGSADYKQHLNLSTYAFEVIQNDIRSFMEKPSLSGFINKVLEEYIEIAEASISRAYGKKMDDLSDMLRDIPNSDDKEKIINILSEKYRDDLISISNNYPREQYVKFRLNKHNFNLLFENDCPEEQYYDSQGKYIKAIVEEYSRKTPLEREAIFFCDRIAYIQSCIDSGNLLRINSRNNWTYEVKPYRIQSDTSALYHYLIGIASSPADRDKAPKIASFRISFLREISMRPKSYKSGRITNEEKELIEKQVQSKGVQFLLGENQEIRVRLSNKGKKMYDTQLHLRPITSRVDADGTYVFFCTPSQIEYYFFKFGSDAEILFPEELRIRFQNKYKDALNKYTDKEGIKQ